MENCANVSDRDRLERVWHQQQKYFRVSHYLREQIRKAFYGLIAGLTAEDKLKIWTCSDRFGNTYWNAYDPIYNHSLEQATESELQLWLEQRYNR